MVIDEILLFDNGNAGVVPWYQVVILSMARCCHLMSGPRFDADLVLRSVGQATAVPAAESGASRRFLAHCASGFHPRPGKAGTQWWVRHRRLPAAPEPLRARMWLLEPLVALSSDPGLLQPDPIP